MKTGPLDRLFSEYIRRRAIDLVGGCQRCLALKYDSTKEDGSVYEAYKYLDCSHYHGRTSKSVRWDEDNCIGLCFGCHQYLEHHPHEHEEFFKKHLGEQKWNMLLSRSRPGNKPDQASLILYYTHKVKHLRSEQNA